MESQRSTLHSNKFVDAYLCQVHFKTINGPNDQDRDKVSKMQAYSQFYDKVSVIRVLKCKLTPSRDRRSVSRIDLYTPHYQYGALQEFLRTYEELNFPQASQLLLKIFSQLSYMHQNDIVCLSEEPETIMIDSNLNPVFCRFNPADFSPYDVPKIRSHDVTIVKRLIRSLARHPALAEMYGQIDQRLETCKDATRIYSELSKLFNEDKIIRHKNLMRQPFKARKVYHSVSLEIGSSDQETDFSRSNSELRQAWQ